ncbi:MAG: sulfite exporter TauE/SafE family protein [Chloroflexi bacterium]|nr:MAG: sulfite exporter TauE/SafE family protein [Chloroflexota bacterium]MBL1193758.1 sulfite exporter TauE/SafE family protein [Chloroflexota bacterium]NOH11051.1 sulfite exporter TauE/SafE family protein [Chloroflexota bacterium]
MEWYLYPAVIAAGFVAGFINTLAGSGSVVTLPLLIFVGLPATVANGTNRVAILLQNVVGVSSFRRENMLDTRGALILGIPAVVGSIIGANIAANLNEEVLQTVIGVIMVIMLFVILVRPKRWLEGELTHLEGWPSWWQWLLFFAIGMYGGFIQAGVGVFLLAGLVLGAGYDLVRANAVKVGIVLLFTIFALAVFVLNDQVNWFIGFVLAIGNMLGAWVATKVAVDKGAIWVRRLLIVVVIFSAARFLGIIDWLGTLF